MFGLFHKKSKTEDRAKESDQRCKMIKECTLTNMIIAHVKPFFDHYNEKTGSHITIEFCENELLMYSQHTFDMPLSGSELGLHQWIEEYQSSPTVLELPKELDLHSNEFLSGYESDDSYECLFEQIRDSYAKQSEHVAHLAFAVSPWSEMFGCADCIRIFW